VRTLDETRAAAVEALCELLVPGSGRVGPAVYVDAVLTAMPPEFAFVRALAIEAYYSDFVAPGREGPGAWEEIDFNTPLARRLDKDWSYLGIA
jgi:hypothetical protein